MEELIITTCHPGEVFLCQELRPRIAVALFFRTTHIIASNLPDVKVRQLKGSETIVKPDWIVACIEAGRLLDFAPFLLYTNATNGHHFMFHDQTNEAGELMSWEGFCPALYKKSKIS